MDKLNSTATTRATEPISTFDPVQYKISTKTNWNTVATAYHKDWASTYAGPFKSAKELVKLAQMNPSDIVLDLACGTGAVSNEITKAICERLDLVRGGVGDQGFIIGVDISRSALSIAKSSLSPNPIKSMLVEMDAENLGFRKSFFDKIFCQFGLMFFPNPLSSLKELHQILKKDGKLLVSVHGTSKCVPYFSCIMDSILKYIPDIRPTGSPSVHRFGNPDDLLSILNGAGFSKSSVKKHTYYYKAGTFEEYWSDYMDSTANSIRPIIQSKGDRITSAIKKDARETADGYADLGGIITFPWDVLIATAFSS